MASRPINICLIASGSTDWQLHDRIQGSNDLPISGPGLTEVSVSATAWAPHPTIRTIYCSPDSASLRTAELYAQQAHGIKVRALPELVEVDMGLWQGLTSLELSERYTKAFARWQHDPAHASAPSGESAAEAAQRIAAVIRKRSRRSSKPDAVHLTLVIRPILGRIARAILSGEPADMTAEPEAVANYTFDRATAARRTA